MYAEELPDSKALLGDEHIGGESAPYLEGFCSSKSIRKELLEIGGLRKIVLFKEIGFKKKGGGGSQLDFSKGCTAHSFKIIMKLESIKRNYQDLTLLCQKFSKAYSYTKIAKESTLVPD